MPSIPESSAVRALLGIHAVCEAPVEEEIVSGVENDPDIQQKSRTDAAFDTDICEKGYPACAQ